MPSLEHEKMLVSGIEAMHNKGYRVIRLDKRKVPDAIAIKDGEVVAVEAETSVTGAWTTTRKYEKNREYDRQVILRKPLSDVFFSFEAYKRALELRKRGLTYVAIASEVEREFHRKPSMGAMHKWFAGKAEARVLKYIRYGERYGRRSG
jgi:hypothetical protein